MPDAEYHFRYFREPHTFSTYTAAPQTCGICGLILPGYEGPFYGEHDMEFVCEPCLAGGRLAEKDLATNTGAELSPELEQRTPPIVTWQTLLWPCHCGDYCCYWGEVGQPDLNHLALDGDGKAFFAAHLSEGYGADAEYLQEIWAGVRPDTPPDKPLTWSQGVYLFQCLHCRDYVIEWDCD